MKRVWKGKKDALTDSSYIGDRCYMHVLLRFPALNSQVPTFADTMGM